LAITHQLITKTRSAADFLLPGESTTNAPLSWLSSYIRSAKAVP
jgi:hypothetical protein